ncbi:hypothetical protein NUW58_g1960 [Xylaria curta]|uniref:Uncharacterized protein n=1 Tax=Xylaria curta TaxID=42375 RepID=A0ACC1PHT0_9PEZI|nr:hypothetical protein NUW58_g1960 [Xylaria curta]
MRLLLLLPVSLLAAFTLGQTGLPPPGSPALEYTDGAFLEPNGGTLEYGQGNKMNITNSAQSWFQWDVTTDSKNSSEIYVFRAVNGTGTAEQKALGGFLSAAFRIPVKETAGPTTTLSTLTTSATGPSNTAASADPGITPSTTSEPGSGISGGAKIGIGVGVGVGVVGLAALAAAFLFWRKTKGRKQSPGPQPYEMPLNTDFSPQPQIAQPYGVDHQNLAGYYKPPETGATRGAELDAGQGHQFITEANPDHSRRAELQ